MVMGNADKPREVGHVPAGGKPRRVWREWTSHVLADEGLECWIVRDAPDGYCWCHGSATSLGPTLDCIEGDHALFLHEVAHALTELVPGNQHHGIWAGLYTRLVRDYMVVR